ncbi:uncharacterized protein LOC106874491 [Octopus bimaculoides]|uniref:uncharacterized protein LOC106874491 n=1 Tax=Octopus bimaculoides TaxID=37653 RepID=UPI00071E0988|nr:uncharacterized protein LOC106874491 [Octopus bimaculoides]|eukprot:XP_014777721.1 PREDICTED: uncharacterized protein LOC106874491 [Octopus bimaculoides]
MIWFKFIKEERNLSVKSITVDFEKAAINSIKKLFPRVSVFGCFFHFGQCLWSKIHATGLQTWYTEGENAFIIKQLQALAFVPPNDVTTLFEQLLHSLSAQTDEILEEFLTYFECTWVGIMQRGRPRRPLYDISLQSCYNRVLNDLPKTNNTLEEWHRAFSRRVNFHHPNLSKLIEKLGVEQSHRNGNRTGHIRS